jgi:hypothetical protein
VDAVAEKMSKSIASVKTGEVTVATRTVEIDGVNVESGQVIALLDGKLVLSAQSIEEAVMGFLEKADAASHELITFYYGEDLNRNEANRIADVARGKYSSLEIEVQDGGQPHYPFLISVE